MQARPVRRVPSAPIAPTAPFYGTECAGRATLRPAHAFLPGRRGRQRGSFDEVHAPGIGPGDERHRHRAGHAPDRSANHACAACTAERRATATTARRSRHAGRSRNTAAAVHQSAARRPGCARGSGRGDGPHPARAAAPSGSGSGATAARGGRTDAFGSEELSALLQDHQGSLPPVAVRGGRPQRPPLPVTPAQAGMMAAVAG